MLIGLLRSLIRWSMLSCILGGALWALSPLGLYILAEYRYFPLTMLWKLFPSAVLLMLVGVIGLWFWVRAPGWPERIGFAAVIAGIVLVVAGAVGKYWLGIDDLYIMTAPAYKTFRVGLVVLTAGSLLFGAAAARSRSLPVWAALPFAVASLAGLISVLQDFEYLGVAMWVLFGIGWVWIGLSLLVANTASSLRKRRVR